ncbi:hypothetical protein OE187_00985 [Klebsiella pneumoniae]|uniref:hypothetical protein n=1 Tax=Klebsiella pneumoniae complex TaxID=3390273 RepID=UPI0021D9DCBE|nr:MULTISPECIES: hypothetical protein [Klebsiella]MCU8658066.1 hypothetical protein [Klebsiella pneumoniae]MDE4644416.1 hypothetical protein [Klebsiella quasipneumoniae subsp. similipneumoniae]
MTDTAYSKSLEKEVDPEQYLRLTGHTIDTIHTFAQEDIVCPICEATGGTFVRSGTNARFNRRAHFRFRNTKDKSNHHPSCDFYDEHISPYVKNHLVYFSTDRTKITHVIRKMVCAGIQKKVFNQESMRQMRRWFFQKRVDSTFKLFLTEEQVSWLHYITVNTSVNWGDVNGVVPFSPVQATIPGFSWVDAIQREFTLVHLPTLRKLHNLKVWRKQLSILSKFVSSPSHGLLIDPTLLKDEYEKTLQLNAFIISSYDEFKNKSVRDRADGEVKLLAFSALLLFVSDWDIHQAIEKFAIIANVDEVDDDLAGNFIGLNPYLKFELADTARKLQENWPIEYKEIDYWQVEKRMRAMYEEDQKSRSTSLPPLPADIYISDHLKREEEEERIRRWCEADRIEFDNDITE